MGVIDYNERIVFTHTDYRVCQKDLERSRVCEGSIATAFFSRNVFRDKNFRRPRKLSFREIRVKDADSGLILCLDSTVLSGRIPLRFPIYEWDRVLKFFQEARVSPRDLYLLKGRRMEQYHQGNFLLAISFGKQEDVKDNSPKVLS